MAAVGALWGQIILHFTRLLALANFNLTIRPMLFDTFFSI